MILGNPERPDVTAQAANHATLDDLFRRAAARNPQTVALVDPPNRETFTDGAPRRLTYIEADRVVSAIAARLRGFGLQTDTVVAFQIPNTVESILVMLGVLRAGMIAAPMPLLWRTTDATAALGRVGAKVLITSAQIGATRHDELAMRTAAELFPIRFVCSFGRDIPDGVVPMDDLFAQAKAGSVPTGERPGNPAAHVAAITWDVTAGGLVPVARNHLELTAGGLAVFLEGGIAPDANLLSAIPIASFAGIAMTLMPWLLSGGTLALHHAFDPETFAHQEKREGCNVIVLPGPLVTRLAEAGHLSGEKLKTIAALWRAPERLSSIAAWRGAGAVLDVAAFGEAGLLASRRGPGGKPSTIAFGIVSAPHGSLNAIMVAEVTRTEAGTLALRGPMVPAQAFPPGAENNGAPHLELDDHGFVDTGFTCRFERDPRMRSLVVTGPPPGLASIGGYRFSLREVEALVDSLQAGGTLAALPDALTGQRLAGSAPDRAAVQAKLAERGINPLIAGAFRRRGTATAA